MICLYCDAIAKSRGSAHYQRWLSQIPMDRPVVFRPRYHKTKALEICLYCNRTDIQGFQLCKMHGRWYCGRPMEFTRKQKTRKPTGKVWIAGGGYRA